MLRFTSVTNYCKEKPTVLSIFFSCGCLGGYIKDIPTVYNSIFCGHELSWIIGFGTIHMHSLFVNKLADRDLVESVKFFWKNLAHILWMEL